MSDKRLPALPTFTEATVCQHAARDASRVLPHPAATKARTVTPRQASDLIATRLRLLQLDADVRHRMTFRPRLELDPLVEELPHRLARREERERDEDPREAVDLPARE